MTIRVALNGFGRIGRAVLRAHIELNPHADIDIVAINELASIESSAHLLKYDSSHGVLDASVDLVDNNTLQVNETSIHYLSVADPKALPWASLGIDIVIECTGQFFERAQVKQHIAAGAKKVLLSSPSETEVDASIVYGVNHHDITPQHHIISNSSCTTNCLAPLAKVLEDNVGIASGVATVIHAYTNDQKLTDTHHPDFRRARAAGVSIIPTATQSVSAVGKIVPSLQGKLEGLGLRVPTANVALVDLSVTTQRETTVDELHAMFAKAAAGDLKNVLDLNSAPLVSVDFNHHSASCIVDTTQTIVQSGRLVKLLAWYDNEWGYANRLLDTAHTMMTVQ